jgi:hypothetical protein
MKDWKVRQEIYHRLTAHIDRGDDLDNFEVIEEHEPEKILQRALEYPFIQRHELYYPGKSFAIAVIYARLLEKLFKEDPIEALRDPMLLYGNDPFFKTYDECPEVYDQLLQQLPQTVEFDDPQWSDDMKRTLQYFKDEFMLEKEPLYADSNA